MRTFSNFKKNLQLALILLIAQSLASPQNQNSIDSGKLSLTLGKVYIWNHTSGEWVLGKRGMTVFLRDSLKTDPKSRCELKFKGYGVIRVGEVSKLCVEDISRKKLSIDIEMGRIWINMLLDRKRTDIRTPTAVAAIRGTTYRIDCDTNSSKINVYKGLVGVTPVIAGELSADSTFMISQGEEFISTRDVIEYISAQKKLIESYVKETEEEFKRFLMEEEEAISKYAELQDSDFKQYYTLNIAKRKFDPEQDSKDDWVRWNQNLDE